MSYPNRKYEVFLSFRGKDTRASFTSHLSAALKNAGITVFTDDESLPRGDNISKSLLHAIEESQISVVVFSRNYAESRWCLEELEKIMECHRTIGQVVLPVFYDVDPSEVRHQTGHFGKAFQNLLNRILNKESGYNNPSMEWKEALGTAACILGTVALQSSFGSKIQNIPFPDCWLNDRRFMKERISLIRPDMDLNCSVNMEIVEEINHYMRYFREGLCKAAGIRQFEVINFREMEMSNNGIDLLLNHWRKALCEATGISGVAGLNYSKVEMEMANNEIDLLMKYWRESLLEAADMSRFAVLSSKGKVNMEKYPCVKQWAEALHEAASISGVVVLNTRNEAEAIKNIVENVTHSLDKTELFVANNPVGVEARVQEMIQLISKKASKDVLLLGIWGMGGIGKTTIAKAIYNKIGRNFEGRSFLANIREIWEQDAGQVSLQEQLLFDIYRETTTKIHNVEYGKNILQTRFCYKKVLIVLDDVNKLDQLNALCGSDKWFGRGSRIVITTRDKHIIRGNRVHKVHIMKEMDERESTELFSWNAFKQASPKEGFTELSKSVVSYCGGLPLALEVLGCYLFDMSITEWESVLEKLKRIPNDQVQKKLKISYDGLSDDTEKEIFLDIACFFIGMDRYDVIQILNGCRLYAENGIRVLVERSLVTINDKNKLGMHDLLRDMGREIIRAKSPMEPEKRSRLWFHDDVVDILLKKKGTNSIEGLTLMLSTTNSKCVSTTAFKKMKKLRLLQLVGVQLDGDFKHLSRDLRWLCWNGFSLKCIPTNLYRSSLVSIELENSNIKFIWKEAQFMENLKILNLSHSHNMIETPDFSNLPNLEKLILIDCPKLSKVSHTIGHLSKIILINLKDCISLCKLPRSIYKLKSLKTLILSGCLMIDKLEEDLEQMESLTTLMADNTAITRVPFSVVRSKSIGFISLCGHEGYSRDVFPSIIWSWMSPTNTPSSLLQSYAGMSSLVSLNVPNSTSHDLSTIQEDLPKLRTLWIECNSTIQLSRDMKTILDALYAATNYKELESTATASQVPIIECSNQVHNSGSESSLKSLLIQMGMNYQASSIFEESILQNMTTSECDGGLLLGDNDHDWFTFNCDGSSVIFDVPRVNGYNLKAIMCVVHYFNPENVTSDGLKNVLVINHSKLTIQLFKRDTLASFENEEWHRLASNIEPGNHMEVVVVFENGFIVKKTTVYLIYDKPIDKKIEYCHSSNKTVVSSGNEDTSTVGWISPQVESIDDFQHTQKRRKFD